MALDEQPRRRGAPLLTRQLTTSLVVLLVALSALVVPRSGLAAGTSTINGTTYEVTIISAGAIADTPGDDVILGSEGRDLIVGNGGNDVVCARGGDDDVTTLDGVDQIGGGDGDDKLRGGEGDDLLVGGADDDAVAGQGGDDTLFGGVGDDCFDGGTGASDACFGEEGVDGFRVAAPGGCETTIGIP